MCSRSFVFRVSSPAEGRVVATTNYRALCRSYRALVLIALVIALVGAAASCSGTRASGPDGDTRPDVGLDRGALAAAMDIAQLEAARSFSGERLASYARSEQGADPALRARAARGLGRIGDKRAVVVLEQLMSDPDPAVRRAAIRGLGMAEARGAESGLAVRFLSESDLAVKRAILLALGQLGSEQSLPLLSAALRDSAVRAAAAAGLGRFGRRSIAFDDATRTALGRAARAADVDARKAVAFALAREHDAPTGAGMDALRALVGDPDPEVRALAIRAWVSRAGEPEILVRAVQDRDWRVRVEVMRGLGKSLRQPGAAAGAVGVAWADAVAIEWTGLVMSKWRGERIQVLTAALSAIGSETAEPAVQEVVAKLYREVEGRIGASEWSSLDPAARRVISTVHCLLAAAAVRLGAGALEAVRGCGGESVTTGMPLAERRGLLAELLAAGKGGTGAERIAGWAILKAHSDGNVRARAIAALPKLMADPAIAGTPALIATLQEGLEQALADPAVEVAGTAVGALAELHKQSATAEYAGAAVGALVRRAEAPETNVELTISLMGTVAAMRAQAGEPICRRAHQHANRSVRASARACLEALSGQDPGPGQPREQPPATPVDIADVIGVKLSWTLLTDKGSIRIALDPDVAPWHVAAIVRLTRQGFYQGLNFHRVIGNFVAQGGDPDGTGWGGPDFPIPAEPSELEYVRGTVGIADAGLDTGGSQLFIAHARLHHLDARYTIIGRVVEGQEVVDSLIVGDRIESAQITVHQSAP